jgi:hypothetical protein
MLPGAHAVVAGGVFDVIEVARAFGAHGNELEDADHATRLANKRSEGKGP